MQTEGLRVINRMILNKMDKIEDLTGKMFHELDKELELECIEAMDSMRICVKNTVIAKLNTKIEELI